MPKKGPRIIADYLIPNLDAGTFGEHLEWVAKGEKIFRMVYKHKNCSSWTVDDAAVFVEWDRLKDPDRHRPDEQEYYTLSRQRMKAAIHKLVNIGVLQRISIGAVDSKDFKYYKILREKASKDISKSSKKKKICNCDTNSQCTCRTNKTRKDDRHNVGIKLEDRHNANAIDDDWHNVGMKHNDQSNATTKKDDWHNVGMKHNDQSNATKKKDDWHNVGMKHNAQSNATTKKECTVIIKYDDQHDVGIKDYDQHNESTKKDYPWKSERKTDEHRSVLKRNDCQSSACTNTDDRHCNDATKNDRQGNANRNPANQFNASTKIVTGKCNAITQCTTYKKHSQVNTPFSKVKFLVPVPPTGKQFPKVQFVVPVSTTAARFPKMHFIVPVPSAAMRNVDPGVRKKQTLVWYGKPTILKSNGDGNRPSTVWDYETEKILKSNTYEDANGSIQRTSKVMVPKDNVFKCRLCDRLFRQRRKLNQHWNYAHSSRLFRLLNNGAADVTNRTKTSSYVKVDVLLDIISVLF